MPQTDNLHLRVIGAGMADAQDRAFGELGNDNRPSRAWSALRTTLLLIGLGGYIAWALTILALTGAFL